MSHHIPDVIEPVLVAVPESVETRRLLLRMPRAGDGAVLHAALSESLAEMRRFLGSLPWIAREQSVESSELYCRTAQANFIARKDLPYLVFEKATGYLVGGCGIHRMVWATPKAEVGYWCRTSRTGNGFVGEAVAALVEVAMRDLRAVRLEIVTDAENEASRKLAQRCGFVLEGILRNERRAPDGSLRDTCIYARIVA